MAESIPTTSGQKSASGPSTPARLMWGAYLLLSTLAMFTLLAQTTFSAAASPAGRADTTTEANTTGFPFGAPPAVEAKAAFIFDADTGLVLYSKDANEELPQASCTKIMTALVALERMPLDHVITVGADAQALVNPDSSNMGLAAGERLTLRDLLYGLLLPSGNDAAVAIADGVAGSAPAFVSLMNQRARQLGLTRTRFANPHGLDAPGHYTTAHDLALLAAVALRNPDFRTIVMTTEYHIPATNDHQAHDLVTGDDLLNGARSPYPGDIGGKPGYTGAAGYCMAFAAVRRGRMIVGAVLDDPSWQVRIGDMRALLDWGFLQEGLPVAPSPTPWGTAPTV